MSAENRFPECIYLGEFHSKEHGSLPACIPANLGGFCLHYLQEEAAQARRLVENAVLCALQDAPAGLLKVEIIDFSNRPNFPFLSQLKAEGLCRTWLNEQTSMQAFNELESLVQYRYHQLFSRGEAHLDEYNMRSQRPEAYHLLVIDTACFPAGGLSAQRLQNFMQAAYGAGIYIIALHEVGQVQEWQEKARDALLAGLTAIRPVQDFAWLQVDEALLPVEKMTQVGGFEFVPADINQSQIVSQLKDAISAPVDESSSDFLHIAIGQQANGDTAYLSLGERSENYSVVLLGVPGSGKSSLMNNFITEIARHYHAGEVRLQLVDFAGVEFGQFKSHPNVEKIFLDVGEPQQGIAFLEGLRPEMEERKALFMAKGVRNITEYNRANPQQTLHHTLVMIDEFHRLFRGDYRHQARVNALLEEIIREWRKFGIYLFLCTQTLQDVPMDRSLVNLLGLRMSYRVANEATLGYDTMFHRENARRILALDKYEVLAQASNTRSYQAYVHPPVADAAQIFAQARLSRPAHLQTRAIVGVAHKQAEEGIVSTPMPQGVASPAHAAVSAVQAASTMSPKPASEQADNPNQQAFVRLDELIGSLQQKLASESPAGGADAGEDLPDWLKN